MIALLLSDIWTKDYTYPMILEFSLAHRMSETATITGMEGVKSDFPKDAAVLMAISCVTLNYL